MELRSAVPPAVGQPSTMAMLSLKDGKNTSEKSSGPRRTEKLEAFQKMTAELLLKRRTQREN